MFTWYDKSGTKKNYAINMKMPTIVGIFIFISRENYMLSWVEKEKKFYNLWAKEHSLIKLIVSSTYNNLGPVVQS